MRSQLYRSGNVALTLFVVDVFAVLETCMSDANVADLFVFFFRR